MADGDAEGAQDSEDELDRELRELTEPNSSTPRIHEPSAAQRAAAARRAATATTNANLTAMPGTGKRKPKRTGLGGVIAAWTVVIAVLAGSGALTWFHFHSSPVRTSAARGTKPTRHPTPTPSVSSAAVLITSSPLFVNTGPPADPFAGTPSDGWADGAAGITVPAARAHGPFTAAQVQAAYQTTRKLLIAANLDWPTLRGGTPNAFASLLTSGQRHEFLTGLGKKGLDKQGFQLSTRDWVTSFAPGTTKFVTTVVKVHGSMSATTAVSSGSTVLRIKVNYLFVYAVEPPGLPGDWMRVVDQEYGNVDFATWDDPGGQLEPWTQISGSTAGVQCGTTDGYIHPDYSNGPPSGVQPSGSPVNPYSTAPPPSSDTYRCRNTTGT
jgi:hypothetical protein